eukprot:1505506-Rhodomonas_salina.1
MNWTKESQESKARPLSKQRSCLAFSATPRTGQGKGRSLGCDVPLVLLRCPTPGPKHPLHSQHCNAQEIRERRRREKNHTSHLKTLPTTQGRTTQEPNDEKLEREVKRRKGARNG